MLAATAIDSPQKTQQFAWLILTPLTPQQFREALDAEPDFLYLGVLYDNLLTNRLRRKGPMHNAVVVEGTVMRDIKKWWLDNVSEEVKDMIQKGYYEDMPIFKINLSRNVPYGTNNPGECMLNGCPFYDLPRLLKKTLAPDAAQEIVNQIRSLDGDDAHGIYEVRIAPEQPGSSLFKIAVIRWTPAP